MQRAKTDQIGRMARLISVVAWRTGHFIDHVMMQLKWQECFHFFSINTDSNEWKFFADAFYVKYMVCV